MIRKIRKLILHPNLYFYDYFRKKLGFRKYFVTDKIKLLDAGNHQKWQKLLLSHPYLYLYYKFNKRLHKPSYPILVDYRIETLAENAMGGGKRVVLAVELERENIIYFADPRIVQKALDNKEPYLAGKIFKFNFWGSGNRVFIDKGVRFGSKFKIDVAGNQNIINFKSDCRLQGGLISLQGNDNSIKLGGNCVIKPAAFIVFKGCNNSLIACSGCIFAPGMRVNFLKDNNILYMGKDTRLRHSSNVSFKGTNALGYICGNTTSLFPEIWMGSDLIFFWGFRSTVNGGSLCHLREAKNVIIGSDCMLSWDILLRNAVGHSIYDACTKSRISRGGSIIIGDHVWINMHAKIFNGSRINSGSVIAAGSILSNKDIPERCIAAGVPAKVIRENILWSHSGPADATDEGVKLFDTYQENIQEKNVVRIGWDNLLKIDQINPSAKAQDKLECINQILGINTVEVI